MGKTCEARALTDDRSNSSLVLSGELEVDVTMDPIKPTFSEVVYSELGTWLGRTPCKGSDTTVNFDIRHGMAVAFIKSTGRWTTVCCDLGWTDHRHESLGCDGLSTHPNR